MLSPVLLSSEHDASDFTCGIPDLDIWLKKRALANQANGASRSYVIADGEKIVGYYCLASGTIALADAPGSIRRNMPNPIPSIIFGRLAVDRSWQSKRLGVSLLQDAIDRTIAASTIVGIRAIFVHAISDPAKTFYNHYGFIESPTQPMMMILPIR